MKTSILHLPLVLLVVLGLASTISAYVYGQEPPTARSGSGVGRPAACDNPPCVMESYGPGLNTGQNVPMPPPLTPEQQERRDQERRYSGLFGDLEGLERLAQSYEAAGDTVNAASWRADFARKSGLTPEDAEIVKRIAAQYLKDFVALNESCRTDQLTARHTYGTDQAARSKFLETSTCKQLRDLLPKTLSDLLVALGSKSFTRLDGYTRHMFDNARVLNRQGQPVNSQPQIPPATNEKTEMPNEMD